MELENDKARIGSALKLARDILKRCKIKEAPVSLRTVIGLLQTTHDLGVYPASNFSDRLSAILVTIEDEPASVYRHEIHFNSNDSWHRRRFSIAHEIGHLLFNTSHVNTNGDGYDSSSPDEREANAFAAELLMPLAFLKKDLKQAGANISSLAWRYIVSREAMGWKVVTGNLLTRL